MVVLTKTLGIICILASFVFCTLWIGAWWKTKSKLTLMLGLYFCMFGVVRTYWEVWFHLGMPEGWRSNLYIDTIWVLIFSSLILGAWFAFTEVPRRPIKGLTGSICGTCKFNPKFLKD